MASSKEEFKKGQLLKIVTHTVYLGKYFKHISQYPENWNHGLHEIEDVFRINV